MFRPKQFSSLSFHINALNRAQIPSAILHFSMHRASPIDILLKFRLFHLQQPEPGFHTRLDRDYFSLREADMIA
jgi:hypothetical protein